MYEVRNINSDKCPIWDAYPIEVETYNDLYFETLEEAEEAADFFNAEWMRKEEE